MEQIRSRRGSRDVTTIADVARLAGVSPMTVSRVVNKARNVSETTRQAVTAAVVQLGYEPNLAARNLARSQHVRLGSIYSNPSAGFLAEFLVGLLDATQREGITLSIVRCGDDAEAQIESVGQLLKSGVTGVVLPPPLSESKAIQQALAQAGVLVATVAGAGPSGEAVSVRINDREAAHALTQRLLNLGHRRIGVIGGPANHISSAERLAGARSAIATQPDAVLILAQGRFDYASGLVGAEKLLDRRIVPTAIFALNDDMAAAAISVAHRRGLDVPRDLSVAGFDDTSLAVTLWPPLTTVRQPVREMATRATAFLVERLRRGDRGGPTPSMDEVLPHTVIERGSTSSPSLHPPDRQ